MLDWIADPQAWLALATLTGLEIVLGIDNIIFISILVARLPEQERARARTLGLGAAMGMRIGLLFSLTWVMGLTAPLFSIVGEAISGRDLILLSGGLFLLGKSTVEIHNALEGDEEHHGGQKGATFWSVLIQIAIIDMVFSLDSVITAVGLVDKISVMVLAIIISVLVMMFAAKSIGEFVDKHPTIKMLALSFLVLIGVALIGEGLDFTIPKGYIYFAMAFSVLVELLNMGIRKRSKSPVVLHKPLVNQAKLSDNN